MPNEEYDDDLLKLEEQESEQDNSAELPPSDIVAYNELRSCADLKRMYDSKQLIIKPDFQRDIVWNKPAQTRFIDSLMKQLPIPSMCISLDYKTNERLIIDGLQRMQTIINFLSDDTWVLSSLEDIDKKISGKSVFAIKTKSPEIYDRIENLTIPVTVIRCDNSKKSHNEYLFTIFHRLNTGGVKLNNQEIRNCIYGGTFNELLKELVLYQPFRHIMKLKKDETYRFIYEEFILRFFALEEKYDKYKGQLSKFLNDYMNDNRNLNEVDIEEKQSLFIRTIELLQRTLKNEPMPKLSKTTVEGIFIGIAKNIDTLECKTDHALHDAYMNLRNHPDYSIDSLKEGLSAKSKVQSRINVAVDIFMI